VDRGLTGTDHAVETTGLRELLIIAQLPPPVHGASVVNAMVVNSSELRKRFTVSVVPIDASKNLSDIRKFSVLKVLRSFRVLAKIIGHMVFDRPQVCYLTLAPHGFAFYRDCLFVAVFRIFKTRHVVHLHGRGMAHNHKSGASALLARFALGKALVVHLSPLLLADIAPFVASNHVRFVANGVADPYRGVPIQKSRGKVACILFLSTMLEAKVRWFCLRPYQF
jgi:hypothetical protein